MKVVIGNAAHEGSRGEQQDNFGFSNFNDKQFFAHAGIMAFVADGMGGLAGGQQASCRATQAMQKAYSRKQSWESIQNALACSLGQANKAVVELAEELDQQGNVGTTLVAAVVHNDLLYWISVGDSRLYLCRNGKLTCLTVDHNFWYELSEKVNKGEISLEEAKQLDERNMLISYLGLKELKLVDRSINPFKLQNGDRLLLCSDGLYNVLEEDEIKEIILKPPQQAADLLIEKVLQKQNHYQDNVTVAIMGMDNSKFCKKQKIVRFFPIVIMIGIILLFLGYLRDQFDWLNLYELINSTVKEANK